MRIKTRNYFINITFEWIGFGYALMRGNKHKRSMYFLGIATIETVDRRTYPNLKSQLFEWEPFSKEEYNGKWSDL